MGAPGMATPGVQTRGRPRAMHDAETGGGTAAARAGVASRCGGGGREASM